MTAPVRSPAVLCMGNVSIDETVHLDGRRTLAAGGDAVYAALGALLVTPRARMCAPVGADLPVETLTELTGVGLDADRLPRRPLPTLRHVITHRADGGRDWLSNATDAEFDIMSPAPADLLPEDRMTDGIVLSAMGLQAQWELSRHLADWSATVYLDLREDYLDAADALRDMVSRAQVFLPSEIEAAALSSSSDVAQAAETLAELGPGTVVIKRGAAGCHVLTDGAHHDVPATDTDVVDTTGAGDAFCGAFAAAHAHSGDAVAAARIAASVAAVAVSGLGTSALLAAVVARRRATAVTA